MKGLDQWLTQTPEEYHGTTEYDGLCEVIHAPQGDHGLEGFNLGDRYYYSYHEQDKNGQPYYRVYHDETYYETCGVRTFKKHFREEEQNNEQ